MPHTPGPWKTGYSGHSVYGPDRDFGAGQTTHVICICRSPARTEENKANARLIAAAPELLDALQIVRDCGQPTPVSLYDEEAIEGWRWTHPDGREWEEIGDHGAPPPLHPAARAAIASATGKEE